jgi:hypothetical protein
VGPLRYRHRKSCQSCDKARSSRQSGTLSYSVLPSTLKTAQRSSKIEVSRGNRSSPRPISTGQLHALLHFHLRPIYLVVYKGPYFRRMGNLILRLVSRLDAFSAYPLRTWLLSNAPGGTTDTPAVRPSRSSRTRDRSSQISCAHDG